jgi:hypothetical protein
MTNLDKRENRSTIDDVDVVIPGFGEKARLIAGVGINVMGASVLLAHGVRFLGWSI